MVTLESTVSVPAHVLSRDVDGEAVILNQDTGQYYGLNEIGTRMWALLVQFGQVAQVLRSLLDEYDVAEPELARDVLSLIEELAAHGLLQIDEN